MIELAPYLNLVVSGTVQGLIIALAALAVSLSFAVARFPNAATGDIMTVGAYSAVIVQAATGSLLLGSAVSVIACVAISLACYILIFRKLESRPLVASLIASIGIAFFLRSMLTLFLGFDQQVFRVPIMRAMNYSGVRILPLDLWLSCLAAIVLAGVFLTLFFTPLGRRMRAVSADMNLARASGIKTGQVMLWLWAIVGLLSAVSGIMVGIKTVVTPELGWDLLLPAFAAAILGGIGSPIGAVLAALVLGVVQELSTPLVGFTYKIALSFVALIAVLILRPQGLFGRAEEVR